MISVKDDQQKLSLSDLGRGFVGKMICERRSHLYQCSKEVLWYIDRTTCEVRICHHLNPKGKFVGNAVQHFPSNVIMSPAF